MKTTDMVALDLFPSSNYRQAPPVGLVLLWHVQILHHTRPDITGAGTLRNRYVYRNSYLVYGDGESKTATSVSHSRQRLVPNSHEEFSSIPPVVTLQYSQIASPRNGPHANAPDPHVPSGTPNSSDE